MKNVKASEVMQRQWHDDRKDFEYAKDIMFEETCDTIVKIMDEIDSENAWR